MHELRAQIDIADRAIDRALANCRHSRAFFSNDAAAYADKRKRLLDAYERRYDAIRKRFRNEPAVAEQEVA